MRMQQSLVDNLIKCFAAKFVVDVEEASDYF